MNKNVKKIILVLVLFCSFFIINNVFAAEWGYEFKEIAGDKDQFKYTVTFKNTEKNDTYTIGSDVGWKDINVSKRGAVSKELLTRIKKQNLQLFMEKIEEILNLRSKDSKEFLRQYGESIPMGVTSGGRSTTLVYKHEEVLAYDCKQLMLKLKMAANDDDFAKYSEYKYTKFLDDGSYGGPVTTSSTKFDKDKLDAKQEEFDNLLEKWNWFRTMRGIDVLRNLTTGTSSTTVDMNVDTSTIDSTNDDILGDYNQNSSTTVAPTEERDYHAKDIDWWAAAKEFFGLSEANKDEGQSNAAEVLVNELTDWIFEIGNMIFIIVTSVLGVKYIFGSAEGKAQIKDSLITLIVAALFFYGWEAIKNLLDVQGLLNSSDTMVSAATKVYNTVLFIVNLLAIVGIIWIGVKYMLSSAEGKSQIKTSWGPLILGIIMVYATVKFLTKIVTVFLGS